MERGKLTARNLVLYTLLFLNLFVIIAYFTSFFQGVISDSVHWVGKGDLIFGGLAAFGGITNLMGVWLTVQYARGKRSHPALIGPCLALTGFLIGSGALCIFGVGNACNVYGRWDQCL